MVFSKNLDIICRLNSLKTNLVLRNYLKIEYLSEYLLEI